MENKKRLYLLILVFSVGLSFSLIRMVYGASEVRLDANWLAQAGSGPYKLTKSDTTYVLDTDITTIGSAFLLGSAAGCPKNVILDLNGHTITYADMDFTGVENPGFEEGDPNDAQIPLGWDLAGAHGHAARRDYTQKLFFDNYSLYISNIAGDAYAEEYVLSSPVSLTVPGKYAITAEVQGGPYNVLDSRLAVDGIAVSCTNKVSNMHTSYTGDMSWGLICEFDISSPATVRGKIIVGTKDASKNTSLNVDEMDIRPIDDAASSLNPSFAKYLGMAGIKTNNWNCSMAEIKNGSIIQGRAKAAYSSAISGTGVKKIHDLTIITNGINSANVNEPYGGNMEIYANYMEANGKLPLNRQYFFSMIALDRTNGGNKIYNNTLLNGPHVGINHGDATSGVLNSGKSEIYNNVIKLNINSTNGFSINAGSNVDIHDNQIQPLRGHGIGLSRTSSEVKVYNNLIEPRTWPCSEYSSYSYPNSAHGIRIKNYGSGAISNLEIFNNTIIGKSTPQLANCYTEISGITNYLEDDKDGAISQNVKIHDNNISVETDNYMQQHAMAYKSMGQGEIYNNTLRSNHIIIDMSDNDVGGAKNYKYFYSNTLIKGDNPQGFHTLRYGYWSPANNLFTDTILQNGVDLKDMAFGINNTGFTYPAAAELSIGWHLDFDVKDNAGKALAGAAIEIRDKDNNLITQSATDEAGLARAELKEYTFSCKTKAINSYQYFSPYKIAITKDGHSSFSQEINISQPAALSVQLNSLISPSPADATAPICSNGAPAAGILSAGTTQTNISLTTNENAICKYANTANIAYGAMANTFASTGATSHSTPISSLANGISYSYYVRCSDTSNNINVSDYIISFNVAAVAASDTVAPIISQINTSGISSSGAIITWQTNEAATSKVEYGLASAYGYSTNLDKSLVTSHAVTLNGLKNARTHHFRVISTDQAGNTTHSQDLTFNTLIEENKANGGNTGGVSAAPKSGNTVPAAPKGASLNGNGLYNLPKEIVESISQSEAQIVHGYNKFVPLDNVSKELYLKVVALKSKILTDSEKYSIAMFINIGTETTKILGPGERAGVINSYKSVFNKLPEQSSDWQDLIKIANGRWPAETNKAKEAKTQNEIFHKIYKRAPDMTNANDNAAVTIITYGLRPASRNTESEKAGIRIFKGIYGYNPTSASEWDIVRAIAYSGAKR